MKKISNIRPETIVETEYGSHEFNWDIKQTDDHFEYNSVDVVGELTYSNIKYAMMVERYTNEEITENENAYAQNPDSMDLKIIAYKAVKNWIENTIKSNININSIPE